MTNRPLRLYVDTETTGLDPSVHEIIEIALMLEEVPTDPRAVGRIVDSFETKIKPQRIEAASPEALRVNGYTPEAWADALPFEQHAGRIATMVAKARAVVGHNPKFDTGFLEAEFRRLKINPNIPYHTIDTVGLAYVAWNWVGTGPGLKLDRLREFLGIPVAETHSAMKDVLDCRRVLYLARSAMTGIVYDLEESGVGDASAEKAGRDMYEAFIRTRGRQNDRPWDNIHADSKAAWITLAGTK